MPYLDDLQLSVNSITTSSQNMEFVILATQISTATTNRCMTVKTVNDLPVLTTSTNYPTGQIVFVESINAHVFNSTNKWIGIDNRTLRRDFCERLLYAWGNNTSGQIGDGTTVNRCSPVREFCSATDWCQVSSGGFHTAAIKTSGELWTWGSNSVGLLGIGSSATIGRCSPVREFCSATDWCRVSNGCCHNAAIKTSGQLWTWGLNVAGQLGIGSSATIARCSPVREFCSATDWCQVSAGFYFSTALKTSGELWTWGSNSLGRLGDGTTINRCSPVREFCSATDWCQTSAGNAFAAAIKTSGQLWTWGSNANGRLGIGSSVTLGRCSPVREFCSATDWCQVSAGDILTAAIKTSGQLWTWGGNSDGGLGIGSSATIGRCSPVREFCSATDWCQVSASATVTLVSAIKTSGQLWSWGSNSFGQLGIGSSATIGRCSPVREFFSANTWFQVSASASSVAILVR